MKAKSEYIKKLENEVLKLSSTVEKLTAELKRCHEIMDNCQAEINTYFEKGINESENES
jgi:flagellar biosynthesis chaperone FliJ